MKTRKRRGMQLALHRQMRDAQFQITETPPAPPLAGVISIKTSSAFQSQTDRALFAYSRCRVFNRECLALVADTSLSGRRLARELDAVIVRRAKPRTIVSDNGTEMASMAILEWCQHTHVDWHYIAPGKPMAGTSQAAYAGSASRSVPSRYSLDETSGYPPSLDGLGQLCFVGSNLRRHRAGNDYEQQLYSGKAATCILGPF